MSLRRFRSWHRKLKVFSLIKKNQKDRECLLKSPIGQIVMALLDFRPGVISIKSLIIMSRIDTLLLREKEMLNQRR